MSQYDAVVVGAGPNGLVAANRLADAGWSVLVLEQQSRIGGAVRHDRQLDPDFTHDIFSAFYPLAAASPAIRSLGLERWGLRWRHAPAVLGHPFADGSWALQLPDRDATAARFDARHGGDGAAWLRLCEQWDRIGDELLAVLFSPFPPIRRAGRLLAASAGPGGPGAVRRLLTPAVKTACGFGGVDPGILIAGNAGHADIPLNSVGSGLMGLVLTMLGQTVGFPVPEGGSGELTATLGRRLRAIGGVLECDSTVVAIETDRRSVTGVRCADGRRIAATTVLADVGIPALLDELLTPEQVPTPMRWVRRRFRWDPSTVKVDWALDGPVPWAEPPEAAPGTVHIADSLGQLTEALDQVAAGVIPAAPFLLAGQMTTADPTRSPTGTEAMWAYTRVPQRMIADQRGELGGTWDHDDRERFADRMQERIEALAPGFCSRIRARRVLGPHELQAWNANLVGGAIGGGTQRLRQQTVLRAGLGRPQTGIRGLYLASSAAHPGPGVHGIPGDNAALAALSAPAHGT